jgi:hypothetical protein
MNEHKIMEWLLDSDPCIRWQVLSDLVGASEEEIAAERKKIGVEGWGAKLLSYQDACGMWGGQLYNNKWLSTTYTLLLLRQMGLEPGNSQAQKGCRLLLEGGYQATGSLSYARAAGHTDNGVTGMILSILAYFGYSDERVHGVAAYLQDQQQSDGRWEPYPENEHLRYTFDTTLLVLEGLREYEQQYPEKGEQNAGAQFKGREFLLNHRLYKPKGSGEVVDDKMLLFSFPSRWHYDVLAALDYFQACGAERDARLEDAIHLLMEKQTTEGKWNLQNRHPGKSFFEMEVVGKPSRWNTLRALRVLKWWHNT